MDQSTFEEIIGRIQQLADGNKYELGFSHDGSGDDLIISIGTEYQSTDRCGHVEYHTETINVKFSDVATEEAWLAFNEERERKRLEAARMEKELLEEQLRQRERAEYNRLRRLYGW